MRKSVLAGVARDLIRIARELSASDEGTKVSIDHIEWDLEDYARDGEKEIDTIKRLGLPVDNFVVDVDCDESDEDELDIAAEQAARDYIAENYGDEYADCVISVSWSVY